MAKTTIEKIVVFTATRDGVQASGSTEKKAVELLEKTIKERDAQIATAK